MHTVKSVQVVRLLSEMIRPKFLLHTLGLLGLVFVISSFTALPAAYAASGPLSHHKSHSDGYPDPDPCLEVDIVVSDVHTVPLRKGTGTAYNIDMGVFNDCGEQLRSGGTWSLVANLNCFGQTSLGFSFGGGLPQLNAGSEITTVDQSRVAYCNIIENGQIVEQVPPTQETYYGAANSSFLDNGNVIQANGNGTATLF
jgi:hypothetical protein